MIQQGLINELIVLFEGIETNSANSNIIREIVHNIFFQNNSFTVDLNDISVLNQNNMKISIVLASDDPLSDTSEPKYRFSIVYKNYAVMIDTLSKSDLIK